MFRWLLARIRPASTAHDKETFHHVWQAAHFGPTDAEPEVIVESLGLPWSKQERIEWERHCKRCVNCRGWMYDPLTSLCCNCHDW